MYHFTCQLILLLFTTNAICQENNRVYFKRDYATTQNSFQKLVQKEMECIDSIHFPSMCSYYSYTAAFIDSLALILKSKVDESTRSNQLANFFSLSEIETNDYVDIIKHKEEIDGTHFQALKDIEELRKIAALMRFKARTEDKVSFFPLRGKYDGLFIKPTSLSGNESSFFRKTNLSFSPEFNNYSLFSEVYSDYFYCVNIGVGTALSFGNESDQENEFAIKENSTPSSINRLLNGGGDFIVSLGYPLAMYNSEDGRLQFMASFYNKFATDIKNFSSDRKRPLHLQSQILCSTIFKGINDVISLTFDLKLSKIFGNEYFYQEVNKADSRSFGLYTLGFGMRVRDKFQMSYNYHFGKSYIRENFPSTVSMGMLF